MALTSAERTMINSACESLHSTSLGTAVGALEDKMPTGTVVGNSDAQTLTNKTINISNDTPLTIGTVAGTAEVKATLEFDETTTGVALFNMGSASVPMVLKANPGDVIAHTVNVAHTLGAGDCANLYGTYSKVAITGDGKADITLVGSAPRAYVGTTGGTTIGGEIYASQPWSKHEGTGAITAMSGLSCMANVGADAFTCNTVNAGHFHIQGAATVTGQFDCVMLEAYPTITNMDSMLCLAVDTGAVVASAIRVTGALATNFINIAAASAGVVIAAGTTLTHDPNAATSDAYLVVKIADTDYALPLYQI